MELVDLSDPGSPSAVGPECAAERRSDCKRCERGQAMELWQTDALGGVRLSESDSAGRVYDHVMARWVGPRSGVGRLIIQLVVLAVVVGGVYLLVLMLGSGLRGSTLQVSDARWG